MSALEELFLQLWNNKYPEIKWEREVRLSKKRRFRWDFFHPDSLVAVEIQGGIYIKSKHSTGQGITRDCEKLFLASEMGVAQFNLTPQMIGNKEYMNRLYEAIQKRLGANNIAPNIKQNKKK